MNKYIEKFKNKIISFVDAKSEINNLNKIIFKLNEENTRLKNKVKHIEEELNEIIEKIENKS